MNIEKLESLYKIEASTDGKTWLSKTVNQFLINVKNSQTIMVAEQVPTVASGDLLKEIDIAEEISALSDHEKVLYWMNSSPSPKLSSAWTFRISEKPKDEEPNSKEA